MTFLRAWTASLASLTLLGLTLPSAQAVTFTDSGTGAINLTAGFTAGGTSLPASSTTQASDTLVFSSAAASTQTDDYSFALKPGVITFSNSAPLTLNKGAGTLITLNGTVNLNNSAPVTDNLDFTGNVNFTGDGTGGFTLGGSINSFNAPLTKSGSSTLTLSGTHSFLQTISITGGTLALGANGVLGGAFVLLNNAGSVFDLAGFSGGNLLSSNNLPTSTVTSSVAGGILGISGGGQNSTPPINNLLYSGMLSLLVVGRGSSDVGTGLGFLTSNGNNSFSGGLTIQGNNGVGGVGSLTTSNLLATGGVTATNVGVVQANASFGSGSGLGTGTITLNNGSLYVVSAPTLSNAVAVTANGGILHSDVHGASSGTTIGGSLSGTGLLALINGFQADSGFSGDMSGFSGTLAIDTTNTGNVNLSGSALGSPTATVMFYGTGTNPSTVEWNGTTVGTTTVSFGELVNGPGNNSANSLGRLSSAVNAAIVYLIGDNTTNAPSFGGVIQDGSAVGPNGVAVTMTGTDTQSLTGANTYSGGTTISGGNLRITSNTGVSATGTGPVVLSGGTGAVLSGGGISTGALTVTNNSVLAPGINVAGSNYGSLNAILTVGTGNSTTAGGATLTAATLDYDLASTAPNGASDRIAMNSGSTLGGALSLGTLTLNFNELNGALNTVAAYTLISGASLSSLQPGASTGSFAASTTFLNGPAYTPVYNLTADGLTVQFAAAPEQAETATMSLIGLGMLGLFLRARKRRLAEVTETVRVDFSKKK